MQLNKYSVFIDGYTRVKKTVIVEADNEDEALEEAQHETGADDIYDWTIKKVKEND